MHATQQQNRTEEDVNTRHAGSSQSRLVLRGNVNASSLRRLAEAQSLLAPPVSDNDKKLAKALAFQLSGRGQMPVYLTRAVWCRYVEVPPKVHCQDEQGRLWDILTMFRWQAKKADTDLIAFRLYVRNDNRRPRLVTLKATCSANDIDDPQPAITIMLPDED
jgi:hypothetical protein